MNDLEWMENIPDYLTFDSLEFKPHRLAKGLDDIEIPEDSPIDRFASFRDMIHATMTFETGEHISVVAGGMIGDLENGVYEVFSSVMEDPTLMTPNEITEHMKELQNIE